MNNKFFIIIFPFIFFAILFGLIFILARGIGKRYHKNSVLLFLGLILILGIIIITPWFFDVSFIGMIPTIGISTFLNIYFAKMIFSQFYSIKKKSKNIIILIPTLIWAIGIIGFTGGFDVILYHKIIPDSFEMPLGDLSGIAVDSEGNIYCGAQFYSRFQVYNAQGKFLYGKHFNSGGGAFKIKINSDDKLEIMTYRGDRKYLFDKDGTLLYKRENFSSYEVGFEHVDDFYYYDKKQEITYQIKPILLPPVILAHSTLIAPFGAHVVEKDASGKEKVIIKTPFYKWIFMGPFPAFLFAMIGGWLLFVFDEDLRNKVSTGMGYWKSKE